jgi:hypothetical protein
VYVLWGPIGQSGLDITGAVTYEYQYKIKTDPTWTSGTMPVGYQEDPTITTLNFKLSGLTPSVTYQVQMRAQDANGVYSSWSTTDEVYMLETPWVNHASVKPTEAYIIWGPASGGLDVPNATYYRYQYKRATSSTWLSGTMPLGNKEDASLAVLNFKLSGLTANTTYEVRMKAVDDNGESDWSAVDSFITIRSVVDRYKERHRHERCYFLGKCGRGSAV